MMDKVCCQNCWKSDTCEDARDDAFCAKWQSKEPEKPEGMSPEEKWTTGEENPYE